MENMGGNISMNNCHLLIMDELASHVTMDVVTKARAIGLDLITLMSHTFHALQPLHVFFGFKNFKTTLCACKDSWTLTHRRVGACMEDL